MPGCLASMPEKSIIIIGGGLAGLATGCYAQMNGYRAQILGLQDRDAREMATCDEAIDRIASR